MSFKKLKEKYGEGKEDHFEDSYEYIRYLERMGQKHEANLIRRKIRKEEEEQC